MWIHFFDSFDFVLNCCDLIGGYIIFNSSIPEALLNGGLHTVESHFNLVNYQVVESYVLLIGIMGFFHCIWVFLKLEFHNL